MKTIKTIVMILAMTTINLTAMDYDFVPVDSDKAASVNKWITTGLDTPSSPAEIGLAVDGLFEAINELRSQLRNAQKEICLNTAINKVAMIVNRCSRLFAKINSQEFAETVNSEDLSDLKSLLNSVLTSAEEVCFELTTEQAYYEKLYDTDEINEQDQENRCSEEAHAEETLRYKHIRPRVRYQEQWVF